MDFPFYNEWPASRCFRILSAFTTEVFNKDAFIDCTGLTVEQAVEKPCFCKMRGNARAGENARQKEKGQHGGHDGSRIQQHSVIYRLGIALGID